MELKIGDKNIKLDKYEKTKCNKSIEFNDIFKKKLEELQISNEYKVKEIQSKEDIKDNEKKINTNLRVLERAFSINILENPERFSKENGKLNILDIIDEYGDNVKYSDLNDLSKAIVALWDCGKIDDKDFFAALKWIATKAKELSLQLEGEKRKLTIMNLNAKIKNSNK